jgi:Gelsolin repeat
LDQVAQGKIVKSTLDSSVFYLLDAGFEVFVWMGSDADKVVKLPGMGRADAFCNVKVRTDNALPVSKAGLEPFNILAYRYLVE